MVLGGCAIPTTIAGRRALIRRTEMAERAESAWWRGR
jgi:hypothetical protein